MPTIVDVMLAHPRGAVRVTALRSSDYDGPGVVGSVLGEMIFGNLVAGKKAGSEVRLTIRTRSRT